jgi:ferredoxin-nitrite reductase
MSNEILTNGTPAALNGAFSEEQKSYLQGFVGGSDLARYRQGLPTLLDALGVSLSGDSAAPAKAEEPIPSGPDAIHFHAQNRTMAAGGKLCKEEQAKREEHPFDIWDRMLQHADQAQFPKGTDVFRWKFHGLFQVSPAQDAFMCRLRFANGILNSLQLRRVAELAETCGGGYAHITTRANLQIREIGPENGIRVLNGLTEAGIITKGSGADNIRNITGSPTAGVDAQELIDTRPLAKDLYHYILNHREMFGLPRKFNIAFDGGGAVGVVGDTNDIAFVAVCVGEGQSVPSGVYFRMEMGGITGHGDFARDTGWLLRPEQCVPAAAGVVRAFIEHGDRTDRKKARLKYVLERMGHQGFLAQARKHMAFEPTLFPLEKCEPRPGVNRLGHVGVHAQKQEGFSYIGVVCPVGKLLPNQMRGLAKIADRYGDGDIRLTVWLNLLLANIANEDLPIVQSEIEALGLAWNVSPVRAGLIACTGNFGCKFAASDTKRHALEIADHLDGRVTIGGPLNIHLTGCPHSCAQHYIGDIGLLGTQLSESAESDEMVEGYHVYLGGGTGEQQGLARELAQSVKAQELPPLLEKLLGQYEGTHYEGEEFVDWSRRQDVNELRATIGL